MVSMATEALRETKDDTSYINLALVDHDLVKHRDYDDCHTFTSTVYSAVSTSCEEVQSQHRVW